MSIVIAKLDPADPVALAAWYDVWVASSRHDVPDFPDPGRKAHMMRFTHPWHGMPETAMLAWDGDRAVGFAAAMLPTLDNTGAVYLDLQVHPDRRREGIGTALLEEIFTLARQNDRRLVHTELVVEMPGGAAREGSGAAFLGRNGDKPALLSVRSRWTIDHADDDRWTQLRDEAATHTSGYSLVQWFERTPDDVADAVAALESRLMLDAPTGDLEIDAENVDAVRIHANDETRLGRGDRVYTTAARHDETGDVVAHTMLVVEDGLDEHAWQMITIVDPAHRGHRLGLAVKLANHAYLRRNEPAVCAVDTWNAESNTFMRAVNTQLGFVPVDHWQAWQIAVPADLKG